MRHVACLSFSALLVACASAPDPFSSVDDFDCLNGTCDSAPELSARAAASGAVFRRD